MGFHLPNSGGNESESNVERPGDDMTPAQLEAAIREYAETVDIDVPLEKVDIQISKRLQRAAGKAGRKGGNLFMRFAWKAYQSWGWNDDFEGTIRHELIHIWEYDTHGKGSHGPTFKRKARELNAPRHCPTFAEDEAKWLLVCPSCGKESPRYRTSKVIKSPEGYRTRCCNEQIEVTRP